MSSATSGARSATSGSSSTASTATRALAVDDAVRWLDAYPKARVTEKGLGVQLELAKNLIALLPQMNKTEAANARRKAADRLSEVVRYYSPHKPEALKLLAGRSSPKDSRRAGDQIATLNYADAMSQADTAISTQDWGLARDLLNQAVRQAEAAGEVRKNLNRARYFLAFVDYSDGRYYEAIVLAEHLARRYPEGGLAPKAAEIGLAALTMAYNLYAGWIGKADLDRLVALAQYAAGTWPDTEQADMARDTLGEIAMGRGRYAEAAEWYEAVRPESSRNLDAQVKAGDAHWRLGRNSARRARTPRPTPRPGPPRSGSRPPSRPATRPRPPTDPGRITNANALAEIHRASGRPAEAVTLLEPIAAALGGHPAREHVPLYVATLTILVRAHIAVGQPDRPSPT